MSSVELNGVTVYVSAIESVEDGVSYEYDNLWKQAADAAFVRVLTSVNLEWSAEEDYPKEEDYPAVIVKLTSGREFRIVGKTREEVEQDILWAKRRDR